MGRTDTDDAFGEALERLRGAGSAVLVTGSVPDAVHRQVCGELLGDPGRERVLVRARDGAGSPAVPADSDRVIEYEASARGATAAGRSGADAAPGGPGEVRSAEGTTVSSLPPAAGAVEEALGALGPTAEGEPRVCVDDILSLVDTAGEQETFRFLHIVTGSVRSRGGTCHCHLALPADGTLATTFRALMDATVELELVDGQPRQRWTVHRSGEQGGDGVRSDWLPLDAV